MEPISGAGARPHIAADRPPFPATLLRGVVVLAALSFPAWLVANAVIPWDATNAYAWDFRAFYAAGHEYLHLHSPYVAPALANLTSEENFVYPPPVAALFAPLSLLPYPVAAVLFIVVSGVLLGLSLRLLDVRDWRCYAAAFLSLPVQQGLKIGALSPLLVFLLALVWRYRDRSSIAAPALALLVVSKLFLWPVALLFLITRRFRTFGLAAAGTVIAVVLSALPLGLGVLVTFPKLLNAVSHFESALSFSLYAVGLALGLPAAAATVVTLLVGAALLIAGYRCCRHDESRLFRVLVVAALILSPLVWSHYLAILFVPLALWRPRFSPLWLLSAWALGDGFVFGRSAFLFTAFCILILIPIQAGLVEMPPLSRLQRPWLPGEVAIAGLWIPAAVMLVGAASAVPAVAALRPVTPSSSASGTAFVQLLTHRPSICWRIWTEGVAPGAFAELLRTRPDAVVAAGPLAANGKLTCFHVPPAQASYLSSTYRRRSADYRMLVRAPSGRVVLRGDLLRRVDADSRGLQRVTEASR